MPLTAPWRLPTIVAPRPCRSATGSVRRIFPSLSGPSCRPRPRPWTVLAAVLCCAIGCIRIAAADDGATPPRLVDAPREVVLPAGGGAAYVPLRARDAAGIRLQLVRYPAGMRLQEGAEAGSDGGWTLHWDDPEERFATDAVLEAVVRGDPG